MDKNNRNIRILGSGPSGMAAAITLLKDGCNVSVTEQKKLPGERFNNGWQILENYSSKEDALTELQSMDISNSFFYKAVSDITFYDSALRPFEFHSKKPFGYFLKRGPADDTLDSVLHKQARELGVTISYGQKGNIETSDIVAAGSTHAAGISKEIAFDSDSEDTFITILDNHLTPLGFSYLFIINGRGTIGTAILRDFKHINEYAEHVMLRFKQITKFNIYNVKESVSSVGFYMPNTAIQDGRLFTGESAGFQDYLFGLGIRRSIQSGYLAAQSIINNEDYDKLWKNKFRKNMYSGVLNRYFYEKIDNPGYHACMQIAHRFDFQKIGYRLQNPSVVRLGLSAILQKFWHRGDACRHGNRCRWCRSSK